jgi:hypothetical protein
MHVRLPKPLHGWRAFAGEVGIIVLGVLIALGFEQVAQAIHWRYEAAKAQDALRNEAIALHRCSVAGARKAAADAGAGSGRATGSSAISVRESLCCTQLGVERRCLEID